MLIAYGQELPRMVLMYVRGLHQLPLIEPLIRENSDIDFYLHSQLLTPDNYAHSSLSSARNLFFVRSFDELKYKFNLFGAFVTTDAEATHGHVYSLRLIQLMRLLGIPVLELQHGLFQLGLHYYDQPRGDHFRGDTLPSKSFADHFLLYYPVKGATLAATLIGYPPFGGQLNRGIGGEFLLVLTNLHWTTYTNEERVLFYESVFRYAEAHGDEQIVWRQHPSEIVNTECVNLCNSLAEKYPAAKACIRFQHLNAELAGLSVSDLVSRAKVVVSTISTVLLDCEMGAKRVAVFSAPSVQCLVDRLKTVSTFSDAGQLEELLTKRVRQLKTGCLHAYDNQAFRETLLSLYRTSELTQSEYLTRIIQSMQPLTSELKIGINSIGMRLGKFAVDCLHQLSGLSAQVRVLSGADAKIDATVAEQREQAAKLDGIVSAQREQARRQVETARAIGGQDAKLDAAVAEQREQAAKLDGIVSVQREQARRQVETARAIGGQDAKLDAVVRTLNGHDKTLAALVGMLADVQKGAEKACAQQFEMMELLVGRLQEQTEEKSRFVAEIARLTDDIRSRSVELAILKEKLAVRAAEIVELRRTQTAVAEKMRQANACIEAKERRLRELSSALECEERGRMAAATRLAAVERWNVWCFAARCICGCLPYGVVVTWRRMVYGSCEDRSLLFYPGAFKRMKRLVKFLLPYAVVRVVCEC